MKDVPVPFNERIALDFPNEVALALGLRPKGVRRLAHLPPPDGLPIKRLTERRAVVLVEDLRKWLASRSGS